MTGARARSAHPAGRHALLVELPDAEHTAAFHAEVLRRRAAGTLPPVTEVVPGARTVLLDGVPDPAALAREVLGWEVPPVPDGDGEVVEIPVRYDGPDLADVAARWGVAPEEVGARHGSYTYRVAFCGLRPASGTSPACRTTCTCPAGPHPGPGCPPGPSRWPVPTARSTPVPRRVAGS